MSYPRMRIRTLMIAVLAVGILVAIGIDLLGIRPSASQLRSRALYHRSKVILWRYLFEKARIGDTGVEDMIKRIEFHASMERKYDQAAQHPWLPVPPDPPEP